jgi:hypothetical protein
MNRPKTGSTYYLVLGLIIFPLGLLMLLRVSPIIDLITQLMPGTQTVQIFGLILQFLGEGLICFGIIGAISGKVTANTDYNRQVLVASNVRSTQEQTAFVASFKRSVDDQIAQLHAKLNQLQAQRAAAPIAQAPSKCRFCGAKIERGSFCLSCGKAN